jgi:hypothetical protein
MSGIGCALGGGEGVHGRRDGLAGTVEGRLGAGCAGGKRSVSNVSVNLVLAMCHALSEVVTERARAELVSARRRNRG